MELDELSAVVKQCNKNLESLGRIASALHEIAMECERMAKEMKAPDVRDDLPEDDDDESLGHPAGPKPDPGEGYREPTEKDIGGDIEVRDSFMDPWQVGTLTKILSDGIGRFRCSHDRSGAVSWNWQFARIKIETPEPAWEPKVGDWVRVTRPDDWEGCRDPDWLPIMHEYHGKVMQVSSYENRRGAWCAKCDGVGWFFHRDWLTPSIQYFAEPPEIDKPLETEYQRPSLPKDAGKLCEFSDDGESWVKGYLRGFDCDKNWNEGIGWLCAQNFLDDRAGHRFARIKKD